jgi:ketosteroid isomerase-like protein
MSELTSSLAAETAALRDAYAALNRNDIPATVTAFDPQIEWTEPAEYPGSGTYYGHAGVTAHLSQARGSWAEGSCEPERFVVAGDKIVVFVHVRVRLKDSMEWHEGRLGDVYTFRNGKAIQMRAFADRRQALEWAGVTDSKASRPTARDRRRAP